MIIKSMTLLLDGKEYTYTSENNSGLHYDFFGTYLHIYQLNDKKKNVLLCILYEASIIEFERISI